MAWNTVKRFLEIYEVGVNVFVIFYAITIHQVRQDYQSVRRSISRHKPELLIRNDIILHCKFHETLVSYGCEATG